METNMPVIRRKLDMPSQHIDLDVQRLKVLVRREGAHMVALCLQYDIAVQATNVQDLGKKMTHCIATQILLDLSKGKKPLSDMKRSPEAYWDAWTKGLTLQAPSTCICDGPERSVVSDAGRLVRNADFAIA